MPIDSRKKPPVLNDEQIAAEESRFLNEVMRELTIEGYPPGGALHADLQGARDRLRVESRLGPNHEPNHEVWYSSARTGGRMKTPRDTALDLVAVAGERAARAAYGSDPVGDTVSRLKGLGVAHDEAMERAGQRIGRDLDDGNVLGGRVWVQTRDSNEKRYFAPPLKKDGEYSPEQLAVYREHSSAVAFATRAILEERDRGEPAGIVTRSDPAQRAGEIRAQIAAAF